MFEVQEFDRVLVVGKMYAEILFDLVEESSGMDLLEEHCGFKKKGKELHK